MFWEKGVLVATSHTPCVRCFPLAPDKPDHPAKPDPPAKDQKRRPFRALNHDLSSLSNDPNEIVRETMNDRHLRQPDPSPNQAPNSQTRPLSWAYRKNDLESTGHFARRALETQSASLEKDHVSRHYR